MAWLEPDRIRTSSASCIACTRCGEHVFVLTASSIPLTSEGSLAAAAAEATINRRRESKRLLSNDEAAQRLPVFLFACCFRAESHQSSGRSREVFVSAFVGIRDLLGLCGRSKRPNNGFWADKLVNLKHTRLAFGRRRSLFLPGVFTWSQCRWGPANKGPASRIFHCSEADVRRVRSEVGS